MSEDATACRTVEEWAEHFIRSPAMHTKRAPAAPPTEWADPAPAPLRIATPGRPPELDLIGKAHRSLDPTKLGVPAKRAQLLHAFWHHELQAAELMCWAILAFPATPAAFRRGLLGICQDELRHMGMYERHLTELGFEIGAFPVRDWFWQRVPACESPLQYVALMGMGLEGSNLDHTRRFAAAFRAAGDEAGAALQEKVGEEEVPHVQFALHWFREWTGDAEVDFDTWRATLVPPLTPTMMRGRPLDAERRRRAGFSDAFVDALAAWDAQ